MKYLDGRFIDLLRGEVAGLPDRAIASALAAGASALFQKINIVRVETPEDSPGSGTWTIELPSDWLFGRVLRAYLPPPTADQQYRDSGWMITASSRHGKPSVMTSAAAPSVPTVSWPAVRAADECPPAARLLTYTIAPSPFAEGLDDVFVAQLRKALKLAAIVDGELRSYLSPDGLAARRGGGAPAWQNEYAAEIRALMLEYGGEASGEPIQVAPQIGPPAAFARRRPGFYWSFVGGFYR